MSPTNTENVSMTPTNQPSLFGKLVSYFQNNIMKIRESTQRTTLREYTTSRTKKRPRKAGKSTRRKPTIRKTKIIKTQRKKK